MKAGIGAAAGIVGDLALGLGIFFFVRQSRKTSHELEAKEMAGPVEIGDEKLCAAELVGSHGVSEAPAPVPPQEMEGSPVVLTNHAEIVLRNENT